MLHKLFTPAVMAALLFAVGLPAKSQIQYGSDEPVPADLSQQAAAAKAEFSSVLANALSPDSLAAMLRLIKDQPKPAVGGVTNFDNVSAPCRFEDTTPLLGLEQFAAFRAPPPNGGAILNECSHFGMSAHSPPNFLAFNSASAYSLGGVPRTPELIVVEPSKSSVSLWISGGINPSFPVGVVALGSGGFKGLVIAFTNSEWQQVTVTGVGIEAIALVGNPTYLVVDDIESQ